MKKLLFGACVALLPITGFSATILGFQVGSGIWAHDPSGSISTSADVGVTADLKNDFNLSEEEEGYVYAVLEHPVPLIPNFKLVNTKLTSNGTGTLSTAFDFNGQTYNISSDVTTKLQLDQKDYIFYWEILDNVVSVDLGINAKQIDGNASVTSTIDPDTTITFSGTIPMLYAAAEIMLPSGFTIAAEISTISAGANAITDTTAKLTYTTDFGLGVEAGLRSQNYTIDMDSVKANMDFSGMFAGVYYKF
ncbi:MAG: TIGR04219 family outer membrane beta-barrel protein [Gammaproteobacteria bacterium]|nr:TIGR04219 family outer membrane beta-barrel protein [Gammaproteobacteria bacterium]